MAQGWTRWIGPWFWGLLAIAIYVRFWGLGYPAEKVFDETHYVSAALVMAGIEPATGLEAWAQSDTPIVARTPDPNFSHPPLGKMLMVGSIRLFGNTPWAWRLPVALASILSLLLVYGIMARLTSDPWTAWLAMFFMSFDIMHVVQSRIAMLDMFLLCACLGMMGAVLILVDHPKSFWGNVACVVSIGIGLSIKFTVVLTIAAVFAVYTFYGRTSRPLLRFLHCSILALCGGLLYCLWSIYFMVHGFSLAEWFYFQWVSVAKVLGPLKSHPYSSMPISWPFNHKPVWYYYKGGDWPEGIVALGHPLLWWGALWGLFIVAVERRVKDSLAANYLLIWYALSYLPLIIVLWRRSDASFLFHMLPTTAPMMMALAYAVRSEIRDRRWHFALLGVVLAVFGFFSPVIFAVPAPGSYYNILANLISF